MLRLGVLLKTKQPHFLRYYLLRDDRDIARLYEIVDGIWRAIEAGAFYPRCCGGVRRMRSIGRGDWLGISDH